MQRRLATKLALKLLHSVAETHWIGAMSYLLLFSTQNKKKQHRVSISKL